ncbi:hypothetical protein HED50_20025 [Ochrobactrum oryzae]|uniref:Uncharacterized protein n=1 Tax=Brucella oryzae TaxID=335286 RepID=A0A2S7J114_9HYPH|nr:hypothetical protein [Brucella oryzae]MBR7652570.1 hypothetical protein [Brucella oryzae]NKC23190.1 hypothetical protein [Brucella oryzae]PQA73943.1 hypothetical protein C3731_09010 [Brucella oryzae]
MNNVFAYAVRRESLKWAAAVVVGLSASFCLTAGAEAKDTRKQKSETVSVYLAKYKVNSEVRYNKPASAKVVKVSASQYATGTPYVCTPSGFGQKSRCFIRD